MAYEYILRSIDQTRYLGKIEKVFGTSDWTMSKAGIVSPATGIKLPSLYAWDPSNLVPIVTVKLFMFHDRPF